MFYGYHIIYLFQVLLVVVSALDIKKMLDGVWIDRIYESEYNI